jgi:hypothetical protein
MVQRCVLDLEYVSAHDPGIVGIEPVGKHS